MKEADLFDVTNGEFGGRGKHGPSDDEGEQPLHRHV